MEALFAPCPAAAVGGWSKTKVPGKLAREGHAVAPRARGNGPPARRPQRAARLAAWPTAQARVHAARLPRAGTRGVPRATAEAVEEVTIDNCTVLVVGEEGVGMEVVRRLAKAGSWVTAYHAGESHRKEIEGLGALLALGDGASADRLAKTLRSNTFDAIVYSISSDSPDSLSSLEAQLNVIIAARGAKVPRFVLVSSAGAEDDDTLASVESNLAEGGADLKWTIVRTGPVVEVSASGAPSLKEGSEAPKGSIAASDLAFLVSQILFDKDFENRTVTAVASDA